MTVHKLQDIIRKLDIFANESNIQITPFKSFEDDSIYDVWLIDSTLGKFVLKKAKNVEVDIYITFFKNKIQGVPKFIAKINDDETTYIVIEYIEGKTLPEFETLENDFAGYVVSGSIIMEIGDQKPTILNTGDAFHVPTGTRVRGYCTSGQTARLITALSLETATDR